jgi:hypothetical protein
MAAHKARVFFGSNDHMFQIPAEPRPAVFPTPQSEADWDKELFRGRLQKEVGITMTYECPLSSCRAPPKDHRDGHPDFREPRVAGSRPTTRTSEGRASGARLYYGPIEAAASDIGAEIRPRGSAGGSPSRSRSHVGPPPGGPQRGEPFAITDRDHAKAVMLDLVQSGPPGGSACVSQLRLGQIFGLAQVRIAQGGTRLQAAVERA